jgi:hypothetical protein
MAALAQTQDHRALKTPPRHDRLALLSTCLRAAQADRDGNVPHADLAEESGLGPSPMDQALAQGEVGSDRHTLLWLSLACSPRLDMNAQPVITPDVKRLTIVATRPQVGRPFLADQVRQECLTYSLACRDNHETLSNFTAHRPLAGGGSR